MSRRSSLAVALAALALTAPAAQATPLSSLTEREQQAIAARGVGAPATAPARTVTADDGVDWSAVAIGSAGVGALALLAAGAIALGGRRRLRTQRG